MTSYQAAGAGVYVFAGINAVGCNNNQGWFKGDVKDVRIYSREISQEEAENNSNESLGIPGISITTPLASSSINTWTPLVNWADANECQYSSNNTDWTTADCEGDGSEIPPPGSDGINKQLFIRAKYTGEASYGTSSVVYTFDTTSPVVNAGDNQHRGAVPFTQSTATATDVTSGVASYNWSRLSGPSNVTFSNNGVLNPNITAVGADGTYVLRLTVTDEAGNSASDDFTLLWDTTSPDITLDGFPDFSSNQITATFEFSGSDGLSTPVSYQCKIDDGSFSNCESPKTYSNLGQAEHTFVVRGMDSLGNASEDVLYSWNIVADSTNDKNEDGTIGSLQSNVAGLVSGVTSKAALLVVDDSCTIERALIKAESSHVVQDPGFDYPEGLFNFTLDCGEAGYTTTIRQYYLGVATDSSVLRKYNPNTNAYVRIGLFQELFGMAISA